VVQEPYNISDTSKTIPKDTNAVFLHYFDNDIFIRQVLNDLKEPNNIEEVEKARSMLRYNRNLNAKTFMIKFFSDDDNFSKLFLDSLLAKIIRKNIMDLNRSVNNKLKFIDVQISSNLDKLKKAQAQLVLLKERNQPNDTTYARATWNFNTLEKCYSVLLEKKIEFSISGAGYKAQIELLESPAVYSVKTNRPLKF
jgi:hypothetical protein